MSEVRESIESPSVVSRSIESKRSRSGGFEVGVSKTGGARVRDPGEARLGDLEAGKNALAVVEASAGPLFSIGYGDRPWAAFLGRLQEHEVRFVVDVRSKPASRQREFNRRHLENLLCASGIRYLFLGESLGGRPDDPSCYDPKGRVDYGRCRDRPPFQRGLERLVAAYEGGHRAAVMCSELDAERCHRSKLIGEALAERGIEMTHIDRDGAPVPHSRVIEQLSGSQMALPGTTRSFFSEGRYRPNGER